MMKKASVPYARQIFVCTNDRQGEKPSCGDCQGQKVFEELRKTAKDRGLHPRIRVAQAKCLGQCSTGTDVMIYPEEIWLSGVLPEHVQEIADQFIQEA